MHVRFESREDIVVVLDVRRFLLRVGGGVIGLVRDREILQKEGRSLPDTDYIYDLESGSYRKTDLGKRKRVEHKVIEPKKW